MKKGFVNILVLILVLIGIGFLGYVFYQNLPPRTLENDVVVFTITPSPDITSNWQTYTGFDAEKNKEVFSIKYPKDWKPIEHGSSFYYINPIAAQDNSQISVDFYNNGNTLEEYLKQKDKESQTGWEGKPSKEILSSKKLTVAQFEAVERREKWLAADFETVVTYVKTPNYVFEISVRPGDGSLENSIAYENYYTVLSTFKLIGVNADANFCGGIAAVECPEGYKCKMENNYPDASGTCVKE